MSFRVLACPSCGAPLPPNARRAAVVCAYCHSTVAWEQTVVRAADYRKVLTEGLPSRGAAGLVWLDRMPYRALGSLGRGESNDVYVADRALPRSERVVLKLLRAGEDMDLWSRERRVLIALAESNAHAAGHFGRLVPELVATGSAEISPSESRPALAYRFCSGFVHTLDDVRRAYPSGVDARHAVWIWRRLLEVLGFVHATGLVHSAVLPQHVLLHARDHGVMLVGFSCAGDPHEPLEAIIAARAGLYAKAALDGERSRAADFAMSARTTLHALGSDDGRVPADLPASLGDLLADIVESDGRSAHAGAFALAERVAAAAEAAFGPNRYVHFAMPGWKH